MTEKTKQEIKVEEKQKNSQRANEKNVFESESWKPKTKLGKKVKEGEITDIDEILNNGLKITEPEIIDMLMPELENDLLLIGQSKGKFGGGQRRVFRQTQKKTCEGNKPKFSTCAIIGNKNGYIGLGYGKSKETVPAREKAFRNAKLNMMKIRRGCGSWECGCGNPHTIPFAVTGKCGSSVIKIMPAPKGTGLKIEKECGKILRMAGIEDIWSKTTGSTTKVNLIKACLDALKQLTVTKIKQNDVECLGIVEGIHGGDEK
ncbi:30S ribosomal protein S5 [Candidatus Woesearchaeota archaeon]|nr:30S ribosomal protein S5 [Candidatus Woesearchaeota archaeon]